MSIICRFVFTYSFFIYFIIVRSSSNETLNYVLTHDELLKANNSDLVKRLENYYNYTVLNQTATTAQPKDDAEGERSMVMKIDTPAPRKNFSRTRESVKSSTGQPKSHAWISEPLIEGLKGFRVKSQKNQLCQTQSDLYDAHLKNQTLWAIRSKCFKSLLRIQISVVSSHQYGYLGG